MQPIPVLAFSSISALGRGNAATAEALWAGRTGLRTGSRVLPEADTPVGEVSGDLPPLPVTHGNKALQQCFPVPAKPGPIRLFMNISIHSPHSMRSI